MREPGKPQAKKPQAEVKTGGPPCDEAQADGVPCDELERDCEDCERAEPERRERWARGE